MVCILLKKDIMKIITAEEIANLSIPSKATQMLTFYRFAPFILEEIVVTDSVNYKAFKLMRKRIKS